MSMALRNTGTYCIAFLANDGKVVKRENTIESK